MVKVVIPKGSIQFALFAVSNCDEAEKNLIKNLQLSDDIKQSKQYGSEYFEGSLDKICSIALSTALHCFTQLIILSHTFNK